MNESRIQTQFLDEAVCLENEQAFLHCLFNGASIPPFITGEMFTGRNARYFQAYKKLHGEGLGSIDKQMLCDQLHEWGDLDDYRDKERLSVILDRVAVNAEGAGFYAKKILEAHRKKHLLELTETLRLNINSGMDTETAYAGFQSAFESNTHDNSKPFKPIMLRRIGDIPLTAPQWLVKNFLELSSFSSLYGDSDSGKSFFAIALAFAVATGTDFYGHAVLRQGSVLYLAQEGQNGLSRRFNACSIRSGISIKDAPLFTNALNLQLLDDASVAALIEAISEQVEQIGSVPSFLVLDTWSRVLGGDDSSTTDSARGVAVVDALRKKFEGMTVLVVHHSGHDKTRARGWSGLRAAVDTEYRQSRGEDGVIRIENSKNKEAARIDGLAFEFADVELGIFDEDGEQVTSAVLNQIEYTPEGKGRTEPKGKNQRIALEVLKDLLQESGKEKVLIDDWKAECKRCNIDRRRFSEVLSGLQYSKKILLDTGFVSLAAARPNLCPNPTAYISGSDISDTQAYGRERPIRTVSDISDKDVWHQSQIPKHPELGNSGCNLDGDFVSLPETRPNFYDEDPIW
ncbi:MAG: hypothetical protein Ta2A_07640 [Treponemataceae bacterium]|nr:MAG: hypothetical protein Ta2A_07640 [Treponemataceae bacterium]